MFLLPYSLSIEYHVPRAATFLFFCIFAHCFRVYIWTRNRTFSSLGTMDGVFWNRVADACYVLQAIALIYFAIFYWPTVVYWYTTRWVSFISNVPSFCLIFSFYKLYLIPLIMAIFWSVMTLYFWLKLGVDQFDGNFWPIFRPIMNYGDGDFQFQFFQTSFLFIWKNLHWKINNEY